MLEKLHICSHLVVDAWAIMFPPIGFLGSAENMAAPSTWATTWFVITTATPNYNQKNYKIMKSIILVSHNLK